MELLILMIAAMIFFSSMSICYLRRRIAWLDSQQILEIFQEELEEYQSRYERLSSCAEHHSRRLSADSQRALFEGRQMLGMLQRLLFHAEQLSTSSRMEDWNRVGFLLSGANNSMLEQEGIRCRASQWKSRLEGGIQTVGAELFHLCDRYNNVCSAFEEQFSATSKLLVDLGVRTAVNRMRYDQHRERARFRFVLPQF